MNQTTQGSPQYTPLTFLSTVQGCTGRSFADWSSYWGGWSRHLRFRRQSTDPQQSKRQVRFRIASSFLRCWGGLLQFCRRLRTVRIFTLLVINRLTLLIINSDQNVHFLFDSFWLIIFKSVSEELVSKLTDSATFIPDPQSIKNGSKDLALILSSYCWSSSCLSNKHANSLSQSFYYETRESSSFIYGSKGSLIARLILKLGPHPSSTSKLLF